MYRMEGKSLESRRKEEVDEDEPGCLGG